MTTERFKPIGKEIRQDNEVWCIAGGEHCADVISTALNEQEKCINYLEEQNYRLRDVNHGIERKVFKLLEWLEEAKGIRREEVKEWWNDN